MNENVIQDYYCYVDKADIVDKEIHFLFDGVSKEWYDEFLNENFIISENYEKIIPHIIFATTDYEQLKTSNPNYTLQDFQNVWVHIRLTYKETVFAAQLFIEDNDENPEPILMYVYSVTPLNITNPTVAKLLQNKLSFSMISDATKAELNSALSHPDFDHPDNFVAVYNVGQGNLNAICSPAGNPVLYFDMGGGCYQNRHTYPTTLKLCFSSFKTILLSHWDADHLTTAKRYYGTPGWAAFYGKTWIVPRQSLGASHLKFAMRLRAISTLLIWPSSLRMLSFKAGDIYLCNGPDKNHSGLALVTNLIPGKYNLTKVLLPADAAYTYIPLPPTSKLEAIVATHHGAEFDHSNAPIPISQTETAIAYSYGQKNSYNHPRALAEAAHINSGWLSRKDTCNGNIGFAKFPPVIIAPCGGSCDMSIQQAF